MRSMSAAGSAPVWACSAGGLRDRSARRSSKPQPTLACPRCRRAPSSRRPRPNRRPRRAPAGGQSARGVAAEAQADAPATGRARQAEPKPEASRKPRRPRPRHRRRRWRRCARSTTPSGPEAMRQIREILDSAPEDARQGGLPEARATTGRRNLRSAPRRCMQQARRSMKKDELTQARALSRSARRTSPSCSRRAAELVARSASRGAADSVQNRSFRRSPPPLGQIVNILRLP